MSDRANQLQEAKNDLAFALAQGDGYAEDDADRRIKELQAAIEEEEAVIKELQAAIEEEEAAEAGAL